LEPLYRLAQGSTSIEIYGGYREIGGNCIVIRDGDRKLVLDNGIRFSILRKYYRGGLQPLGVAAFIIICSAHVHWFVLQLKVISIQSIIVLMMR
jgi:hypothetical protein